MLTNPFRYGALLDDAFTTAKPSEQAHRHTERPGRRRLGPRRYGKSSLVWRVSQQAIAQDVLVAHVNLMTTPTSEHAEKLAETIHDDLASTLFRARERLRVFAGLRITPIVTVDPTSGKLGFTFDAGRQPQGPRRNAGAAARASASSLRNADGKVALVLDEFQEVVDIDPELPKLMRSVFELQPDVAHVYLGSKRYMLERIFNDENEPFWRSAKQMELGVIAPPLFRGYGVAVRAHRKAGRPGLVDRVARRPRSVIPTPPRSCATSSGETGEGVTAGDEQYATALEKLLRSEHAHFGLVWEKAARAQRLVLRAIAREPGRPLMGEYRRRHGLPGPSSVQRAPWTRLVKDELVARDASSEYRIAEPFLAEWFAETASSGPLEQRRQDEPDASCRCASVGDVPAEELSYSPWKTAMWMCGARRRKPNRPLRCEIARPGRCERWRPFGR